MKYPDKIYSTFEIIEKQIYGQKHYGLLKHYNIFGVKIKRQQKIADVWSNGKIRSYGNRWVSNRSLVTSAIKDDNEWREYKFREKVTK